MSPARRGSRQSGRRGPTPPSPPPNPPQTPKAGWHKTLKILGAILTPAIIAFVVGEFLGLEIEPQKGPFADPFVARFSMKNPHWLIPMKSLRFLCEGKRIIFAGGNEIRGDKAYNLTWLTPITLKPRKTFEYACPQSVRIPNVLAAQIEITVEYKTLGFMRDPDSEVFTWTSNNPEWVKGPTIN